MEDLKKERGELMLLLEVIRSRVWSNSCEIDVYCGYR